MANEISFEKLLEDNPELVGVTADKVDVIPVEKMEKVRARINKPKIYVKDGRYTAVINLNYPSDAPPVSQKDDLQVIVSFTDPRFFGDISQLNGEITSITGKDKKAFNRSRGELSKLLQAARTTFDQLGGQEILVDAGPAWNDKASYQVYQMYPLPEEA